MADVLILHGKFAQQTLAFGAADTSKEFTVAVSAKSGDDDTITRLFIVIPNWTNAETATVTATDGDGNTLYSKAGLARNTTHDLPDQSDSDDTVNIQVRGDTTIKVELSGVPGGSGGNVLVSGYAESLGGGAAGGSVGDLDDIRAATEATQTAIEIIDDWDESDRAKVNPIVGQAGIAAGAGAVGATVPRVTLASDDPGVALLGTIDTDTGNIATAAAAIQAATEIMDDWDESDRCAVNLISGQAGIAAGAGAVGVTVPRVTLASDDPGVALLGTIDADTGNIATAAAAIQAATEIMDDWDESDRAKVNPIVGQAGVSAGAGAVDAGTPRTTLASDDPAVTALEKIDNTTSPETTTGAIIDLPDNTTNPAEIDCSAAGTHYVMYYSKTEFQFCFAADQTAANTAIGNDSTRRLYPAGTGEFCVSGGSLKLYVRANDASGLTDGFSYGFRGV